MKWLHPHIRSLSRVLRSRRGSMMYIAIFTLLAAMFIGLSSSLTFKGLGNSSRTSIAIHESDQIDDLFRQSFADVLLPFFDGLGNLIACATANWAGNLPINFPTAGFRLESLVNSSQLSRVYTGDANHEAAKQRCDTQQTSGLTVITDWRNVTTLYFCVNFVPTGGGVEPPRIFEDGPVFAEATVFLMDFENNVPLRCFNFRSRALGGSDVRGLQVFYNIYWQKNVKREVATSTTTTGNRYYMRPGSFRLYR